MAEIHVELDPVDVEFDVDCLACGAMLDCKVTQGRTAITVSVEACPGCIEEAVKEARSE